MICNVPGTDVVWHEDYKFGMNNKKRNNTSLRTKINANDAMVIHNLFLSRSLYFYDW